MSYTDPTSPVDWSKLPKPLNDGAVRHLADLTLPNCTLQSTLGKVVDFSKLSGWSVLYFYPMMSGADGAQPDGWDQIPGARGCTPQSCAFRDHKSELFALGIAQIYGISTQNTSEQSEAVTRLHLPFSLLSDQDLELTEALNLPTFTIEDRIFIKRLTLITFNNRIKHVFYPIFPPDQNAEQVLEWLRMTALRG